MPQSICFRLADSLPGSVVRQALADLAAMPEEKARIEQRKRLEDILDRGHGESFLTSPEVAHIVQAALLFFDSDRYRLHAWCIMPNHVHVLITPISEHAHAAIVGSWKSYTALSVNRLLRGEGKVWFREYFDRKIRDERHFEAARYYIEQNTVQAGLCKKAEDWRFSSATLHAKVTAPS
ncbi:REP-associated tyrosine transposase [Labrys okinawensis]|uniref:REP-associated tyrosine transposase n=1 Tax=Labrys okinawensis TaxID=346911 RepID=UPI001AECDB3E|nr:transposase [Labrys okinawensis]